MDLNKEDKRLYAFFILLLINKYKERDLINIIRKAYKVGVKEC